MLLKTKQLSHISLNTLCTTAIVGWIMLGQRELGQLRARVDALERLVTPTAPAADAPLPSFSDAVDAFGTREPWPSSTTSSRMNARRQLAQVAATAPRATLRIDVDDASGVSELVFGAEGAASQVALAHRVNGELVLSRNTSTILEASPTGVTQVGGASRARVYGSRLSFENRADIHVTETVDQASPVWNNSALSIYAGDTVTWTWTSFQNVAQADSSYGTLSAQTRQFYSGALTLGGSYSVRFDDPGVYYFKSQNGATLRGNITVKQFSWENGNLKVDGTLIMNGIASTAIADEVKMFLSANCPPGWIEVPNAAGYMLVSRPTNGTSGAKRNTPFSNGEETRVPPHTHPITDAGHTHGFSALLNDGSPGQPYGYYGATQYRQGAATSVTSSATTGITINQPSNYSLNPQMYVLLCKPVLTV